MLFAALKDKKALTTVLKENLRLKQLRLNINKQKTNKKEHLILLVISFRVDVVSSVLEQLTVVLIVSFYKTLSTFHTLTFTGKCWVGRANQYSDVNINV